MIEMNIWRENKKQKKLFHHVIQQSHALGRHPSKNFSLDLPGRQKSPSNRLYESLNKSVCVYDVEIPLVILGEKSIKFHALQDRNFSFHGPR